MDTRLTNHGFSPNFATVPQAHSDDLSRAVDDKESSSSPRPPGLPTKQPDKAEQRQETIQIDLDKYTWTCVVGLLDPRSQGRAARVCKVWFDAIKMTRLGDLEPLHRPEFTSLLHSFGITLPSPYPLSSEVSAACGALYTRIKNILGAVKESKELSDEEKKPFLSMDLQRIIQEPSSLYGLLNAAYEISLVSPFLDGRNDGPEFLSSMTLTEKAEVVRKHLIEQRGNYTQLQCDGSDMLCFPKELLFLQNLQTLDLRDNHLIAIPDSIGDLTQLYDLDLGFNQLTSIPAGIGRLAKLEILGIGHNQLRTIPDSIGDLAQLRSLFLGSNQLTSIPNSIGDLTQLQHLYLGNNLLTSMPSRIGRLAKLEILHLADNQLRTIPDSIGDLAQLQSLFLGNNLLTSIPDSIGDLAQLQCFIFENNPLRTMPDWTERFTQKIDEI